MLMTALMAHLSFASTADKFLVFTAGSLEARTLKLKSPAAALVPAAWSYSGLVQRKLVEASVSEDLTPASSWNLGNGGKPVRDVGELQTS